MSTLKNNQFITDHQSNTKDEIADNTKTLNHYTRMNIEKSYNIDNTQGTEVYYSNRYGWTLRKIIS